ncbi:GntR family transcriptional regulator [Antarcticirhabdus aurantiaca]|uniref:GntR family transcriptional regulator n=1 Tax=Antarcticirhabdus aurantiaca TaxID=2606717 RepID=UPI00131EC70F|nr:GntR family transcriptional regulator [Antarcticirhabdus aurantiaca]
MQPLVDADKAAAASTSTGANARSTAPTSHMRGAIEVMGASGIGRSTVREVMRHFQALGVVETRRGSGSFLLKPVSAVTIHLPLSIEPDPASRSPHHARRLPRAGG